MKRISLFVGLISSITLTIIMIVLLIMAIIHNNSYKVDDSIVYIESIDDNTIKDGMGFVYKINGDTNYIITNYHVIENSNNLYVYNLDNKKERASIVDFDIYTDIALLEIEDNLDLKESKIGINSVKENDEVYYYNIGKNIIKSGTVLSLDNEINISLDYGNSFYNAVSIKADIDKGNSGGPLFNSNDEVIGLISLKEEDSDVAFYIPIDYVAKIVSKLENHTLVRPNLGGMFANTTNTDILNQYGISVSDIIGVVILDVTEDYPLSMGGIIKGDILTKVNDVIVEDVNDLQKEIYSHNIGDTITLEYYRNNVANTINVVLTK